MRRYVGFAAVMAIVVLLVGCQGPEHLILKKYFNAMQFQDKATLASIAVDPFTMSVTKWEIVSATPEKSEVAQLKALTEAEEAAKKNLDELKGKGREAEALKDEADTILKNARGKARAVAQTEFDTRKAAYDEAVAAVKEAQKTLNLAKAAAALERKVVVLSVGEVAGVEAMEGDFRSKDVIVKITGTAEGEAETTKEYLLKMRVYKMANPATGRAQRGKWIITEMSAKD